MKVIRQKYVSEGSPFVLGGFAVGYNFVLDFLADEKSTVDDLISECESAKIIKSLHNNGPVDSRLHTYVVVVTDADDAMMFKLLVN